MYIETSPLEGKIAELRFNTFCPRPRNEVGMEPKILSSSVFILILFILVSSSDAAGLRGKNCTIAAQCGERLVCNGTCSFCQENVECETIGKLKICSNKSELLPSIPALSEN